MQFQGCKHSCHWHIWPRVDCYENPVIWFVAARFVDRFIFTSECHISVCKPYYKLLFFQGLQVGETRKYQLFVWLFGIPLNVLWLDFTFSDLETNPTSDFVIEVSKPCFLAEIRRT